MNNLKLASTLNKLFYLLPKGDYLKLTVLFIMMLVASFLEVAGIGMIPLFVSIIADPDLIFELEYLHGYLEKLDITSGETLLVYGSILLILIFILKNIYITFFKYIKSKFVWSRFAIISNNLFKKYMRAPYEYHLNRNSSELLRNVTQEAQHLAVFVMIPIINIMMEVVIISGIFIFLVIIEPLITFGVLFLMGLVGIGFLGIIKNKTKQFGKQAQEDRGNMIRVVQEGLGGIKDARILGRETWFEKRLDEHLKRFTKSQTFREVASQASQPLMETFAVGGMLCIALILLWQDRSLSIIIPVLTLFGTATIRLMPSVQHIIQHWTNLRYYIHTINPIYDDTKYLIGARGNEFSKENYIIPFNDEIKFENVSYCYPASEVVVIKNLSLNIKKGEAVGFVGSSGAGKTTLIDLLLGLLVPTKGKIFVDGDEIKSQARAWQNNIGYIPQFIYLQDSSIRENIAFGLPVTEIDENKINRAVEISNLKELIDQLPSGLDTITGEGGIKLSGGQRQRIGIARALYHDPQVIVMDEATSALDNLTESVIMEAIEKLKGIKTVLMIAHRISTVANCDKLFYMDKGCIIDSGSYEDLIKTNKKFKNMALNHRPE